MPSNNQAYDDLVYKLIFCGYEKKFVTLTSIKTDFVRKTETNEIFDIQSPSGCQLILPPSFNDYHIVKNYGFALALFDKQGKEIKGDTLIKIYKEMTSLQQKELCTIFYSNIRYGNYVLYNLVDGIELRPYQKIVFKILNYNINNLDLKRCEIYANLDLFTYTQKESECPPPTAELNPEKLDVELYESSNKSDDNKKCKEDRWWITNLWFYITDKDVYNETYKEKKSRMRCRWR